MLKRENYKIIIMIEIHFNRIYIIESLQSGDKLTGTDLYKEVI